MAQDAQISIDNSNIQFKIHDKFTLFNASNELRSNVNLLAISSSRGLLFAGNPHAAELKVVIIKDLVEAKEQEKEPQVRLVPLPTAANAIACSSDGNQLAVNFTLNACGVLNIYNVQSFTSAANINPTHSIRISPEDHVYAVQLLWNPVLPNNIAVVVSNGGLSMYVLKEGGNFEFHSLDKSYQVKCGCWSPKGKQIALGFPNGKIQQFKPDLILAKTIVCPPNVHSVPFDTIAIHWLSTFQFSVIFLQHGEDCSPSLYIVNAPKAGTPSYMNYYDICYSGNGPRNHQFGFTHIQSWNLLLVTSANGVDLGVLGTKETGDTPNWLQYTLLDEARIEMPLSVTKDETFPIGFVYDTSSTHHLIIGEKQLSTMPMIHVLCTDGTLICFNFLNLKEGAASVCSPPPPIADTSGQFRPLDSFNVGNASTKPATEVNIPAAGDITFAFSPNTVTSTPEPPKDKPVSLFSGFSTNQSAQPTLGFGSALPAAAAPASIKPAVNYSFVGSAGLTIPNSTPAVSVSAFGGVNMANPLGASTIAPNASPFGGITAGKPQTFGGFGGAKLTEPTPSVGSTIAAPIHQPSIATQNSIQPSVNATTTTKPVDLTKPLYSVPATFAAPPTTSNVLSVSSEQREISEAEVDKIVKEIMVVQINAFSNEIQQLKQQTNAIFGNIGNPNEIKSYTKRLNDLQEINDQAKDQDFELDIQNLRYSMNESYGMIAKCRSKLEVYKNPDMAHLMVSNNFDPINRRQLRRLQSYVAANEGQLHIVQQQIDQQWEQYQDVIRRSSKLKMHMPCLEGIYQRMTKLQNVLSQRRLKLNKIKIKLRDRGIHQIDNNNQNQTKANLDNTVESLAESILSINLSQTLNDSQSKLSAEKLQMIRKMTQNQKIRVIKPQRPDRVGLNSEVILETKLKSERVAAAAKIEKEQKDQEKVLSQTTSAIAPLAPKPTEFIPPSSITKPAIPSFAAPTNFSFGNSTPFVKTSVNPPTAPTLVTAPKTIPTDQPTTPTIFAGFGTATATAAKTTTASSIFSFAPAGGLQVGFLPTATPAPPTFGNTNAAAPPTNAIATATNNNSTSLFAGIGNNLTITKVGSQTPSAEKDLKPFEFTPATQTANLFAVTNKTSDTTAPKPFQPSLFNTNTTTGGGFGGSTTGNTLSFGGTTTGSTINFGAFGSALGVSNAAGSTSSSAAPAIGDKSSFSFATIPATITSVNNSLQTSESSKNLFADLVKASTADSTTTTPTTTTTTPNPINLSITSTISELSPTVATSASDYDATTERTAIPSPTQSTESTVSTSSVVIVPKSTFDSSVSVSTIGSTSVASPAATTNTTASVATDSVDKLFGNVNICKPTTKEETKDITSNTNGFIGIGAATGTASGLSFGSSSENNLMATQASESSPFSAASTAAPLISTPATSSMTTETSNGGAMATQSVNSFSFASALSALSVTTAATTTGTISSSMPANITSATNATTAPTSIFGVAAQSSSPFQNNAPTSIANGTPSLFGGKGSATNGSIFTGVASATAPTSGNTFGSIPKPDQSVFGGTNAAAPPTGLFASAAAQIPTPFSSPQTALVGSAIGGGSIFGGTANVQAPANNSVFGSGGGGDGSSIFGGGPAANATPTFGSNSIFGGTSSATNSVKPAIFGAQQANQNVPGASPTSGSIFGQSAFGATPTGGSSIFGTAAPAALPQQQSNPFGGTGNSIFGGGGGNVVGSNAGGSIFGGGNTNSAPAFGGNAFGSFTSPAIGGGGAFSGRASGAFAQGGASVAQTGFGSPSPQQQQQHQQQSAFGTAPAFGSPTPAFGASPTFGGAATFGGPKSFTSFGTGATPTAPNAASPSPFGGQTQKNNLFETLGSTDTGLSFGNLAQSGIANSQKPAFGGSSFMNYRA